MKRRSYQRYKPRSIRIQERRSQSKFIFTGIVALVLLFVGLYWGMPIFISNLTFITHKSNSTSTSSPMEDATLAPPVLNIPFESTNSATISISGYATADSKVEIYVDDIFQKETTTLSDGSFQITDLTLNLGSNSIYGKTKSAENKVSLPSKTIKVTYNNDKPKLELSEPEDNKVITGGDKKVHFSGNIDPNDNLTINDSVVIVDKEGHFSEDKDLNDGDNIFNITATNNFGNSNSLQRKVTYQPS